MPVPEAARFKPAPKKKKAPASADAVDTSVTSEPLQTPAVEVQADAPIVTSVDAPIVTSVETIALSTKSFEPIIVKVKNGVAHVVGRVGETLLYVETNVADMCGATKVWVVGNLAAAQTHSKMMLDPYVLRTTNALKPVIAKVDEVYASTKAKAITVTFPVYAKVVGGVLYVQGTVGNAKVSIQTRASETWSTVASSASSKYAVAYQAADDRVRPIVMWTSSKMTLAKQSSQAAVQPYWIRARDGCVFIQASVGNTVVRIKVGVHDASNRFSAQVLAAYTSVYGAINSYTAPLLAKIVSIYGATKEKVFEILGPYLSKARSMAEYTKTSVNGIVVGVKVKVASVRDIALEYQSACYIKFKNGFIYVRGLVGDKVVFLKVSLEELLSGVSAQATAINSGAKARFFATKARIQDASCTATQVMKSRTSELSSKISVTVKDRGMQVTAVSAVGGAAAMGASGGAAGLTTGTVIGAACGVVPALFTFGLSIPIGAAIGGATGFCAGTVAGGTAGLVGGGLAGRSVHNNQDAINDKMKGSLSKANGCKDYMTEKTKGYKDFVVGKSADLRTRLVGGTGGTD
jgi:hypothetical protein